MFKLLQFTLLASLGFAEEQITLSNAAQDAYAAPDEGYCAAPEADVTLVSDPQDEDVTTDWLKTEPCVCTWAARAEGGDFAAWTADFSEEYQITRIRLLSRYKGDGFTYSLTYDYLRGLDIYVGESLCYTIPDDDTGESNGDWYDFECNESIAGSSIKI